VSRRSGFFEPDDVAISMPPAMNRPAKITASVAETISLIVGATGSRGGHKRVPLAMVSRCCDATPRRPSAKPGAGRTRIVVQKVIARSLRDAGVRGRLHTGLFPDG